MKLRILSSLLLVASVALVTPTKAFAVIQRLNDQPGQIQTFQNDPNIRIDSLNNIHTLKWDGLLPMSRGGTGANSFAVGSVLFSDGTAFAQDNSNFFWDNTNKRLGIGTSSPASALDVTGGLQSKIGSNVILDIASTQRATDNIGVVNISGHSLDSQSGEGATLTIHSDDDTPYALSVYNDAVSSTVPGYKLYIGNDGNFYEDINGNYYQNVNGEYHISASSNKYFIGEYGATINLGGDVNIQQGSVLNVGRIYAIPGVSFDIHGADGGTGVSGGGMYLFGGNGGPGDTRGGDISLFAGKNQGTGRSGHVRLPDPSSGRVADLDTSLLLTLDRTFAFPDASGTFGLLEARQTWNGLNKFEASTNSTIYVGSSVKSGCIAMGDSDGSGVTYVIANDGVLTASMTKPSVCQ